MSNNDTSTKSITLPTFSGDEKDFAIFWPRFKAYATLKKFASVLDAGTSKLPSDPSVFSNDSAVKAEEEKAIEMNDLAMATFTMTFETGELMEYIEEAKTALYPNGLASLVAESLMKKYRPTDRIAGVEAEQELLKLKMKKDEDPDVYFRKLAVLKNKYRHNQATFDNEKMIAATLAKAPAMYSSVLASVLREQGSNLKLTDMQDAMKEHWRIRNNLLNNAEDTDDDSDEEIKETALNALANTVCYNCGKKGHKANKCPEKKKGGKNNSKSKFTGTCHNCGKKGHKVADCWELEKNKHKRPANWKSNSETGNAATEEYCLMCYEVSDSEDEDIEAAASYDENEPNAIENVEESIEVIADAVEDYISSDSNSVESNNNENQSDDKEDKPKYKKATAEEATEYIRRYYELMHKEMADKQYEEWKREQEAKGVVMQPLPWEVTPPNPNVAESNNHPLMDLFHREEREYDSVDDNKKIKASDETALMMADDDNDKDDEQDDESKNSSETDKDKCEKQKNKNSDVQENKNKNEQEDEINDNDNQGLGIATVNVNDDESSLNSEEKLKIWNDVFFPEVDDDPEIYLAWIHTSMMHDYSEVDVSSSDDSSEEESVASTMTTSTTNTTTEVTESIENLNIDDENNNNETDSSNGDEVGAAGIPTTLSDISNEEYWIGDTGATTHLTNSDAGMINMRQAKAGENVVMGNGTAARAQTVGAVLGTICNKNGKELNKLTLSEVTYASNSKFNLFSISAMIKKGWKLNGDNKKLELTKDKQKLVFDIKINTPKGILFCMHVKRNRNEEAANLMLNEESKAQGFIEVALNANKMDMNKAHEIFGHMGQDQTRKICTHLGLDMKKVSFAHTCESCIMGKARQKNIPKISQHDRSNEPNGRIYLDISIIKKPKSNDQVKKVNKGNWCLIVDEYTGFKTTIFTQTKSGMVKPVCEQLSRWKQQGKKVKIIRCDNAGENMKLEKECNSNEQSLNIKFEFTARNTPQQNAPVEKGFDTLYGRGRSIMIAANIPETLRYTLFKEAFKHATTMDNLTVVNINGKDATRFEHFGEDIPNFVKSLRTWGEAGVVTLKSKATPKVGDRGKVCIFVGYAELHASDCYRMFDPDTKRIHTTRDVRWLNRWYYTVDGNKLKTTVFEEENEDNDDSKMRKGKVEVEYETSLKPSNNLPNIPEQNENDEEETSDNDENEEKTQGENENETQLPNPNDKGWTTVTRSGRFTKKPDLFNPETGNVFTQAETNYYQLLADTDEFDGNEVAAMAGSTIRDEIKNIGTNTTINKYQMDISDAFKQKSIYKKRKKCNKTEEKSFDDLLLEFKIRDEIAGIGAGIGGGFENTKELHVMKYNEAMQQPDREQWVKAVREEHDRFIQYNVFKPVKKNEVPNDAKVLTTTWAMKKKSNGTYRARLNMRGYEQVNGEHYDESSISSPVTNDSTIRVVLILMLMAAFRSHIVDVKGAFLHGEFDNGEVIYFKVPQGFETYYDDEEYYLLLLKTAYGLKQAAIMFWRELLKAMKHMGFKRSWADPCLYWKDTEDGILIWLSWIDDCLCIGPKVQVEKSINEMKKLFDCEDVGEMVEYVGCKVERNYETRSLKLTQPVLLQSFEDEFNMPNRVYDTPAEPKKQLKKTIEGQEVTAKEQTKFRSGVGKMLHLMRWSRPDIWNSVRELSRRIVNSNYNHMKAMIRVMKYCIDTRNKGWVLQPERTWDGIKKDFKFILSGKADSNFTTCDETRRSITGYYVALENTVVSCKSGMQKIVALSVTEAEVIALVMCVQEMLYIKKVLESMELEVEKPMKVYSDNKGAVDLANGWSVSGNTKHMEVRIMFLRELKESGALQVEWIPTAENEADIFTKNVEQKLFQKHVSTFCKDG